MTKTIGKITLLISLFSACLAAPVKVNIENYLETDLNYMFIIENKNFKKIVLDCQSFINGVNLYDLQDQKSLFTLDYGQCEDIHWKIVDARKKTGTACLMLEFDLGIYKVTNKACDS